MCIMLTKEECGIQRFQGASKRYLVFINEEPFAVVKGKHLPLNPQLLHHEDGDLSHYRYEIELKEPFTHQ
jgi:hypothetical protein